MFLERSVVIVVVCVVFVAVVVVIVRVVSFRCFHGNLVVVDVVVALDPAVDGEERALKSLGDGRVEVAPLFLAHVEDDVGRVLDSPSRTILFDILI